MAGEDMFVINEHEKSTVLDDRVSRKVLGCGEALMLVEVRFKKGGQGAVHAHVNEQVSYISMGSFEVEIGEVKTVLKQGDSFHVPPNVPHGVEALEDAVIIDVFTPIRPEFLTPEQ
jgi:quercetin dioxygenase-like cupin family protein